MKTSYVLDRMFVCLFDFLPIRSRYQSYGGEDQAPITLYMDACVSESVMRALGTSE